MLKFFVNGMFTNENDVFYMYFLTHIVFSNDDVYKIIIKRKDNNTVVNETTINNSNIVQLLKLQINDDRMENYQKYIYDVLKNNEVITYGSFPIIKNDYTNDINYGFVSCNDNLYNNIPSWNRYSQPNKSTGWIQLALTLPDIIIHMGDQIYADTIYDLYEKGDISLEDVESKVAELYNLSYSEKNQAFAMQNSLNIMIYDDHDFCDSFGTPTKDRTRVNPTVVQYADLMYELMNKYQRQMFVNSSFVSKSENLLSYSLKLGKYNICALDTRGSLYYNDTAFSSDIYNFTQSILEINDKKNVIVVLPRPLVDFSQFYAKLFSYFANDAIDESLHPNNHDGTIRFRNLLFDKIKEQELNLSVVSGDIHVTFLQDHNDPRKGNENIKFTEMVTSGITRFTVNKELLFLRFINKLVFNINCLSTYGINNRRNRSTENNFGTLTNDILINHII